jgi:hypothetical protein
MYRCYLTRGGQIVASEDLDVATLSEAITTGYAVLPYSARRNLTWGHRMS